MQNNLPIAYWLRQKRKAYDLTQRELAEQIGCSPRLVEKIERGERRPSRQIAELLADYFCIPEDEREDFLRFARSDPMESEGSQERQPATEDPAPWHSRPATHVPTADAPRVVGLPAVHSSFIGREALTEELVGLLQERDVRLVTLTGPPGIGKTRLAIDVARRVAAYFESGVTFVPLASLSEPAMVLRAIARALRTSEAAHPSTRDALQARLAGQHHLLVLDNHEHLVSAAAEVASLLDALPGLIVLATSREVLRLSMERAIQVPPLSMPPEKPAAGKPMRPEQLVRYESVRLFVERAAAAHPGFVLTVENARAVAQICAYLGGIPLAIELAAARLRALTAQGVRDRLGMSLQLLTGGPRNLPARQQTLRGAIDWSYNLLDEREKRVLQCLSVFHGGFSLESAEMVCAPGPDGTSDGLTADLTEVLDAVVRLADKSLVYEEPARGGHGERRFDMLQTIREYARERLDDSGHGPALRHRHARVFYELALAAHGEYHGPQQVEWLARLEQEHANLLAALRTYIMSGDAQTALEMTGGLWEFWARRGYWTDGRELIAQALALPGAGTTSLHRAEALLGTAYLAFLQTDFGEGVRDAQEAAAIARELGDGRLTALSLSLLGSMESVTGSRDRARRLHEESLALSERTGRGFEAVLALYGLALVALEGGDLVGAEHRAAESLALAREMGDRLGAAIALRVLALTYLARSDPRSARERGSAGLELFRELGDRRGEALTLQSLGFAELQDGAPEPARSHFLESLRIFRDMGHPQLSPRSVEGLAQVEQARKRPGRAIRLMSAAATLSRDILGQVGAARAGDLPDEAPGEQVGDETYTAEWEQGRLMTLDDVIDYATSPATEAEDPSAGSQSTGWPPPSPGACAPIS